MSIRLFREFLPFSVDEPFPGWYRNLSLKFSIDTDFQNYVIANENKVRELYIACMSFSSLVDSTGFEHPIRRILGKCVYLVVEKSETVESTIDCHGDAPLNVVNPSLSGSLADNVRRVTSLLYEEIANLFYNEEERTWEELLSLSPIKFTVRPLERQDCVVVSIDRFFNIPGPEN